MIIRKDHKTKKSIQNSINVDIDIFPGICALK